MNSGECAISALDSGQRGDVYLRQWLIHGARALLRWVERKAGRTSHWATALKTRRHTYVAVVAMANQIARVAYAVMTTGQPYDPDRHEGRPRYLNTMPDI